jgi:hypothetical protein
MKNTNKNLLALFFSGMALIGISQTGNVLPTAGNVGVGTTTPSNKLEVVGSTKICGKTTMDSTVIIKDSLMTKDVQIDGSVNITGNAKIAGALTVQDQINLSNNYSMKYFPAVGQNPSYTVFGGTNPGTPPAVPFCWPVVPNVNAFNGMMVGYNSTTQGFSGAINLGFDGANSIVEAMSSDPVTSNAALLLNYYCGRDIYMCTGAGGGVVGTGKNFEIGFPARDMNIAANIKAVNKTSLQITNTFSTAGNYSFKNIVNNNTTKAIGVLNNSTGTEVENFVVYGDGVTKITVPNSSLNNFPFLISKEIVAGTYENLFYVKDDGATYIRTTTVTGSGNDRAFSVLDIATGNANFLVKKNGYVWARRFEVTMNNFPDYVFAKEYKKKSLYEVEKFIKENGHLENMPSAEDVEKNGADIGEITRVNVEKTEEIFLYLVEMKKELDELKKQNETLKAKVLELEKH